MKLFEVRFSLRTQQHQQRFPQATRSLLARVTSDVLASGALCIASEYVRDRPFSLDSRPSRLGSSAWLLSCVFWVCLQQAGVLWGQSCVGSVSFFRRLSPHTAHDFVPDFPFSVCVKSGASFLHFFTSAWTCLLARSLSILCPFEKKMWSLGRLRVVGCVQRLLVRGNDVWRSWSQLRPTIFDWWLFFLCEREELRS